MINKTIEAFGYPDTLLKEFDHWVVLLRPVQVTLGSMIVAAKSKATAFEDIKDAAFAEYRDVVQSVEGVLRKEFKAEKINHLMLMMVDPHVHFHVIPRYSSAQTFAGQTFPDHGWPGLPDMASGIKLGSDLRSALIQRLKKDL